MSSLLRRKKTWLSKNSSRFVSDVTTIIEENSNLIIEFTAALGTAVTIEGSAVPGALLYWFDATGTLVSSAGITVTGASFDELSGINNINMTGVLTFTHGGTSINFTSATQTVGTGTASIPDLIGTTQDFVITDTLKVLPEQVLGNKRLLDPIIGDSIGGDNTIIFDTGAIFLTIDPGTQSAGVPIITIPNLGGAPQDFVLSTVAQTVSNKTLTLIQGSMTFDRATNDLTLAVTDQATGIATATIPDLGGVSQDFLFEEVEQTIENKKYSGLVVTDETDNSVATGGSASASDIRDGIITVDTSAGAGSVTLPTATSIITGISNVTAAVGDVIKCLFVAYGSDANALTLSTAAGLTLLGTPRILGNTSRIVYFRITSIGPNAVDVF